MERAITPAKKRGTASEDQPEYQRELTPQNDAQDGADLRGDCAASSADPTQGSLKDSLVAPVQASARRPSIALGPPDPRSLIGALAGATLYFTLAFLSISLSRFDTSLATIWLPSAGAVAFLLRMRLANELAFYAAAFPASLIANMMSGNAAEMALVFSLANMVNVALVTGLTRRTCGPNPDMSDLTTLARFVWIGGLIGPLIAALIAYTAMVPGLPVDTVATSNAQWNTAFEGGVSWFLSDSMGMILIVPTALLAGDALSRQIWPTPRAISECAALLSASLLCAVLVFSQNTYPLLFLIMPMTLVHAFRMGSMGTAIHVALVACVSTAMTWAGHGPIVDTSASPTVRLHLIQAFIAANFLTGLPIAAILAGRDRLTEAVTESRRELALLANSITDAVLKLDARGVCTYASPSVRDVLGREPGAFLGKPLDELTQEDAGQRIADVIMRLLAGQTHKERLTYRRRQDDADGVPVFIEAECATTLDPISAKPEGVVISARDVTERVELELLLTTARRTAENAARAKSDFLANMSHEIRTPMNGVLGFAELMLQGELDGDQRRHVEMIVQSGRSMMLLLNDILDLSKIEAGQITIDTGPIDLQATLDDCVTLHRQSAQKRGVALYLELDSGAQTSDEGLSNPLPTVLIDGLRLRQIVLNLVGNAVKFTQVGEIRVTYWTSADHLYVRVRDTGIGISENRLETIFRPFTQGESDTARRFGGTGLGLSISRQLAERLGGTIEVESKPGVGSTFTLALPTTLLAAEDAVTDPVDTAIPEDLPRDARILLVEDHDVNRELVTEMLELCGQSVATAHDGSEAISMVIDSQLRGRPYDLILMDVQMSQCDGYSATKAIREEGIGPDKLPIIALTANAFPEDIAAAREAGMQAHLAKPVVFADLAHALQRWLPTRIVEAPMDRDVVPLLPLGAVDQGDPGDHLKRAKAKKPTTDAMHDETGDDQVIAVTPGLGVAPWHSESPPVEDEEREGFASGEAPTLFKRWLARRRETVEALRLGLENGLVAKTRVRRAQDVADRTALIRMLHQLAGTAASFQEPELGDNAAALEHAMKGDEPGETCEALAFALLARADEPAEALSQS
ncbi:MAG: ATP-binding protein [Pseudomonadota bacterium]